MTVEVPPVDSSAVIKPLSAALSVETSSTPIIEPASQLVSTISADIPTVEELLTTQSVPPNILEAVLPSSSVPLSSSPTPSRSEPKTASSAKTNNNESFESMVGKRWLTWAGIGMVFLGSVFFLKYAYDQQWLGQVITPPVRVGMLACGAIAMLVMGLRLLGQGMTAIGQGLSGGGIALGYLTIYGAFSPTLMLVPEPLVSGHFAFVLMALVTAGGMTLAVRKNAMAMAFCAVLGGFATPYLIDTGGGSREGLFTYILLLNLGVLGAAWFRRWQALDLLAFGGTVAIYAGWLHLKEGVPIGVVTMTTWLLIFHMIFLLVPFAQHWHLKTAVSVRRFAMVVGNVAFTLGYAAYLLNDEYQLSMALVCFGLAAAYAIAGTVTRLRVPEDEKVVNSFLTIGAMLLMLAWFYLLPVEAIATAWCAEAIVLLMLGYRYAHNLTRIMAHVVFVVAVLRLAVVTLPNAPSDAVFIANSWLMALIVAPLAMAGMAYTHQHFGASGKTTRGCWWLALTLFLGVGSAELIRCHAFTGTPWVMLPLASALSAWWLIGAGILMGAAYRWISPDSARIVIIPVLISTVAAFAAFSVPTVTGYPILNGRFVMALCTVVALYAYSRCHATERPWSGPVVDNGPWTFAAVIMTVLLATLETVAWAFQQDKTGAYSTHHILVAVWSTMAIVCTVLAHQWRNTWIAYAAALTMCLGVIGAFALYTTNDQAIPPLANARFLMVVLSLAALALQRLTFPNRAWLPSFAHVVTTVAFMSEGLAWSEDAFDGDAEVAWRFWSLALISTFSAAYGFFRWSRGASAGAVWIGVVFGGFAMLCSLLGLMAPWLANILFINGRYAVMALTIVVMFYGWTTLRSRPINEEAGLTRFIFWAAAAFLFLSATCEPIAFYNEHYRNDPVARRLSTFAVTVVWVILASTALVVGFRFRQRTMRLLALGLFALTAAKLLLVDMSGFQQIYRILAFMLVGVVLIAASYLYHRLRIR